MLKSSSEYPIGYRIGSEYSANVSREEALQALVGGHEAPDAQHQSGTVYIVRYYPTEEFVPAKDSHRIDVTHKVGEPLFTYRVTVYGRDLGWAELKPARVSFSGNQETPADVFAYTEQVVLAATLAGEANLASCPQCEAEGARRRDRYGEI